MAFRPVRRLSRAGRCVGPALLLALLCPAAAGAQTARILDPAYAEAWLATVREAGREHGLGKRSERIFRTSSGRYYVPDESDRAAILALRSDRATATAMQQAFELRAEAMFAERIGRTPTRRDRAVLAALGPTEGARLIKLAETAPDQAAAAQLHEAARLHRRFFFDGFHERTAHEVWANILSAAPPAAIAKVDKRQVAKAPPAPKKAIALRQGVRETDAAGTLAVAQ